MTPSGRGRTTARRRRLRVAAAALLAAATLLLAAPASAHAELVSSDPVDGSVLPEAPENVTLTFSEPVRLTSQETIVYDDEGRRVASESTASGTQVTVALPGSERLDRGTYVVGWYVLSADGHPVSGSITFSVVEPSVDVAAPPPPPTSSGAVTTVHGIVVGLTYLGLLTAAGLAAFVALVLPRRYDGEPLRSRILTLTRISALTAALGALLQLPIASTYAQGQELDEVVTGFDAGLVVNEMVAAGLLLAGLGVATASMTRHPPGGRRRLALLAGAGAAVLGPSAAGHTRSYAPEALLVVTDVVHVGAGAVWLGGLIGLALTLRRLARREHLAAETLARFSMLAGGLLLAVAAAGALLAWRILGSWSGFVDTSYGLLLLVKIGLALVVAAIGGWNRFGLLPRVQAALGHHARGGAALSVTRTVTVEALVIVALLGVTGFLVNQSPRPPPVQVPAGRTGVETGSLGDDYRVTVDLTPQQRGANVLLVQVQDETGEPVTPPRPPRASVSSIGVDLGDVPLTAAGAGTYRARVLLPQAGHWEVQVGLRLTRFESRVTTLAFHVREPVAD